MIIKSVIDIGAGLFGAARDNLPDVFQTLLSNTKKLNEVLEKEAKRWETIPVIAKCRPNPEAAGGFSVTLDFEELAAAIETHERRIPKLVIRSYSAEINRDLLAEKLEAAIEPLLYIYQEEVDAMRADEEQERFWSGMTSSFEIAEASFGLFGLILLGASALIGPILMLAVAIGGIQILFELPSLVTNSIKQWWFGTEIEQAEAAIEDARELIKKMIGRAKIEVDDSLAD